jgi:diaminohydroxyphosphoribosylaminopyrimidine deaminase/5-amino-6-(5-phosphoribosylamino)uracil reductase
MSTPLDHSTWMQRAIAEAELARGKTGDNPWVGCVVVDDRGELLGLGHTQGPGEDHAEIAAFRQASERGLSVEGATLYSTLEPCSFHGRTPACSRVIVAQEIRRVVTGMRDPHPRVDGVGVRILEEAGIEVIEGVCEQEVRRQLGRWVLQYHPHEPLRRARSLGATLPLAELTARLASIYGITTAEVQVLLGSAIGNEASR